MKNQDELIQELSTEELCEMTFCKENSLPKNKSRIIDFLLIFVFVFCFLPVVCIVLVFYGIGLIFSFFLFIFMELENFVQCNNK